MNPKPDKAADRLQHIAGRTLVDVLRVRARETPERVAFTFLYDSDSAGTDVTFAGLDERARSVAAVLQRRSMKGERALILLPFGLDYLAAFFGCLYAGTVAVPGFPARAGRRLQSDSWFRRVASDARPRLIFAPPETAAKLQSDPENAPSGCVWLSPAEARADQGGGWIPPAISVESAAFLQYTSGSTTDPKGVILTHGNLVHNQEVIRSVCGHDENSTVVSWLPLHHDMGLIGTVIHPAYMGARSILMPPTRFLQEPVSWLKAITRYRAHSSSAPNFAYELCCKRVTAEQKVGLDLSCWQVAINGAEPVRPQTMEAFAAAFRECGFSARTFFPSYGLAESTLMVTGARHSDLPMVRTFSPDSLERGSARVEKDCAPGRLLAGCGRSILGQEIRIVNPETLASAGEQEVGEIWVRGPSVAGGYWGRPEETEEVFRARILGEDGTFLRTGDLGFLQEGELFVTGRRKDLMIVRGRNLYPQDLELTIEQSHGGIRAGAVAVFTAGIENDETVAAVAEVDRKPGGPWVEVINAIRETVLLEYGISLSTVALIRSGTMPRTTSGKIRRATCRSRLLAGELPILAQSRLSAEDEANAGEAPQLSRETILAVDPALREDLVRSQLTAYLRSHLKVPPEGLLPDVPLVSLGLDSLGAAQLVAWLSTATGVSLDVADPLYDANIDSLSAMVVDLCGGAARRTARPSRDAREMPLSLGQRGLWILHHMAPRSSAYILANAARIKGSLDIACLRDAFLDVLSRHQMLRATFELKDGEPMARIHEISDLLQENHFQHQEVPSAEAVNAGRFLENEARRPFALDEAPPVRLRVFSLPDQERWLLLSLHHIVADLGSIAVIVEEINAFYAARLQGRPAFLPEPEAEYADFVEWQQRLIESPKGRASRDFWRRQFETEPAVLELPVDRGRPRNASFEGASEPFRVSPSLRNELKAMARAEQATLFMTLLAAFQAFLHRITAQGELCVGVPVSGRSKHEFSRIVGYCVNTLALRSNNDGTIAFSECLARAKHKMLEAIPHQDYPFPLLVEKLHPQRNAAVSPVFQTLFAWQKLAGDLGALASASSGASSAAFQLAGLRAEPSAIANTGSQFDLTLMMAEDSGGLAAVFKYSTDLFDVATVRRLTRQFSVFLEAAALQPDKSIAALPMLAPAERTELLERWDLRPRQPALPRCAHELFEEQANLAPQSPALVVRGGQLTYGELNALANQFARYMRNLGVGPESRVGICTDRCPEMVAAILGIWKTGASYVPFDPRDPKERLASLIETAALELMIVQENYLGRLPEQLPPLILVDLDMDLIRLEDVSNLDLPVLRDGLAYVIHTSGSTGSPKGVMIQHGCVANLVEGLKHLYEPWSSKRLVVGLNAPLVFDSSVKQLLTLTMGHTLCLVPEDVRRNGPALLEYAEKMGIEVLDCTPTMAQILLEVGLSYPVSLLLGGEAVPAEMWRQLATRGSAVCFNLYGPTECTVDATACSLRARPSPAIGQPLPGTNVYILDRVLEPAPPGAAGEIYIGGASVGRGYLNSPELTAERFLPDPFSGVEGARMYRTGDRARYAGDGLIEFIGRLDRQVKVRGFRIELGEIESALNRHPGVRDAAVVLHTDPAGIQRLLAYVVCSEQHGSPCDRQFLAKTLPEHMVPAIVVNVPGIPTNANGKRDYGALPVPEMEEAQRENQAPPQSDIERYLVTLWTSVLHTSTIGTGDDFFSLGGDSLQATRMIAQVQSHFATNVPLLARFFQEPTIAALSKALGYTARHSAAAANPVSA